MSFDGRPVTGWVDLDHEGTAGTLRYRVVAGVVFVEGSVTIAMATGTGVTLLASANALPADYRPTLSLNMAIARVNVGNQGGIVTALTDGTISVTQATGSAAGTVQFRYSYPVG